MLSREGLNFDHWWGIRASTIPGPRRELGMQCGWTRQCLMVAVAVV